MNRQEQLELIRAACVKTNPAIPLRILLTDKSAKRCVLSRAGIEAGLKPRKREDGVVVGESRDKKSWTVRWYKADGDDTLMYPQGYHKDYIMLLDEDSPAPIHVSDVLLAIEAHDADSERIISINSVGLFEVRYTDSDESAEWNLRQDDLTQQSDECIEFISSLLKA